MKICWKHSSLQSIFPQEHGTNWQWACCSALYPRRNPTLETVISITGDVYVCMGNNILGPLSLLSGLFCEVNWWCVPINAVHSHVYWVPWGILYLFTQHLFSPKKPLQYNTFIFKSFFFIHIHWHALLASRKIRPRGISTFCTTTIATT